MHILKNINTRDNLIVNKQVTGEMFINLQDIIRNGEGVGLMIDPECAGCYRITSIDVRGICRKSDG